MRIKKKRLASRVKEFKDPVIINFKIERKMREGLKKKFGLRLPVMFREWAEGKFNEEVKSTSIDALTKAK